MSGSDQGRFGDTLFLDRDGVINRHRLGDYVKSWDEFEFLPGVIDALSVLKGLFRRIIVVTNQRGVGKGTMTMADLDAIHARMLREVEAGGGRIDKIYCCTAVDNSDPCRKPNAGMALQALDDFPDIDLSRSVMVGDSLSDMEFAGNAGIPFIMVGENNPQGDCRYLKDIIGQYWP